MPKVNFPMVVSIDWLQVYCHLRDVLVECENNRFKMSIIEDFPTAMYRSKCVVYFFEDAKPFEFCEILFRPRVSSIHPNSCHLRIYNEPLYTSSWFDKYCVLMACLPLEYRSLTRVDLACDFNKFYGGLSPRLFIKRYLNGEILKIGINRGYMSFRDMGYVIANGSQRLPDGFKRGLPDFNAITWGSKGYVQTQLYNKSLELREGKFKPWIYSTWERAGLDVRDVWRVEFRIQGAGKECQLLETGDLFAFGTSDFADVERIYQMFSTYADRYFRFVKADYHVKKTQMSPIKFFSYSLDLEPSIKLKINPVKVHSNKTATMVCNFLNEYARRVRNGEIDTKDVELNWHLYMSSVSIEKVFSKMRPVKAEGSDFEIFRHLEDINCKERGRSLLDSSPKRLVSKSSSPH